MSPGRCRPAKSADRPLVSLRANGSLLHPTIRADGKAVQARFGSFSMVKLLGAMAALMSEAVAGEHSGEAIRLVAEPVEEGVRVKVVGAPQHDLEATFSLEVTGARNQSRH